MISTWRKLWLFATSSQTVINEISKATEDIFGFYNEGLAVNELPNYKISLKGKTSG